MYIFYFYFSVKDESNDSDDSWFEVQMVPSETEMPESLATSRWRRATSNQSLAFVSAQASNSIEPAVSGPSTTNTKATANSQPSKRAQSPGSTQVSDTAQPSASMIDSWGPFLTALCQWWDANG